MPPTFQKWWTLTLKSDLNLFETFLNQTYILAVFIGERSKVILFYKNKSIFTFNDTGLDTHRFGKKMNYNYTTRFKFFLSLYPLLILPLKDYVGCFCWLIKLVFIDLKKGLLATFKIISLFSLFDVCETVSEYTFICAKMWVQRIKIALRHFILNHQLQIRKCFK